MDAPEFESRPKDQVAVEGDEVILECAANGYPQPHITWMKNDQILQLHDSSIKQIGQGTLIISDLKQADSGRYVCKATNAEGEETVTARLEVYARPRIVETPKSVVAMETEDVTFSCEVNGVPGPGITWVKDGETIVASEYFRIEGKSLKILGLVINDAGIYQCIVDNVAGSTQASAQLIVERSGKFIAS